MKKSVLKVKNHREFARSAYESAPIAFAELGDVLFKDNEIGIVIQLHDDGDVRCDMWGNCSKSECKNASIQQIKEFRSKVLNALNFELVAPVLKTKDMGFFSDKQNVYINLEVSKSSPNRRGEIISLNNIDNLLVAEIKFRDFNRSIVCY